MRRQGGRGAHRYIICPIVVQHRDDHHSGGGGVMPRARVHTHKKSAVFSPKNRHSLSNSAGEVGLLSNRPEMPPPRSQRCHFRRFHALWGGGACRAGATMEGGGLHGILAGGRVRGGPPIIQGTFAHLGKLQAVQESLVKRGGVDPHLLGGGGG